MHMYTAMLRTAAALQMSRWTVVTWLIKIDTNIKQEVLMFLVLSLHISVLLRLQRCLTRLLIQNEAVRESLSTCSSISF